MTESAVFAAGAVVWRMVGQKLHILVIHRTKYADLTLPKGKVDPGETLAETAVREVYEETGLHVVLGAPVGISKYRLPSRKQKIVHYWCAEATEAAVRESHFVPNKEVAGLEWVSVKRAKETLSYPVDREILTNFEKLIREGALQTFPIIVLRHAKALPRAEWTGTDADRPLTTRGAKQARQIVGPLRAFGVRRIVSSPAVRCLSTVEPLATELGRETHPEPLLSQDAFEAGTADVRTVIGKRVRSRKAVVLCSHRPVIPTIFREISLATGTVEGRYLRDAAELAPGAFSVVHVSATNPGSGIVSIETYESHA
ncbi:NUDIX hydrolase [Microbacterium gorillae]|uniref:NUDIX hydrolase n=1 Tax=Microbacterium gorillae TaxID=1231063 RepID=UPI00058BAA71|nr:NUDIX domain-containing protein [Microbacterium gorillae]